MEQKTIEWLIFRLRELRKSHHWSQEKFSEISGISYKYYQAIEGGRKRELRLSTLERLAKAYGLKVHELLHPGKSSPSAPLPIFGEKKDCYSVTRKKTKKIQAD